jgi:hypothetical protein
MQRFISCSTRFVEVKVGQDQKLELKGSLHGFTSDQAGTLGFLYDGNINNTDKKFNHT